MALLDICTYSTDNVIESISKSSVGVLGDIVNSDMKPFIGISTTHSGSLLDITSKSGFPTIFIHKDQGIVRGFPFVLEFVMRDSTTHITPTPGLSVTAKIAGDGGSFITCINSVVEVSSGVYKIGLLGIELTNVFVMLVFSAVGADDCYVLIKTTVVPTGIGFKKNTAISNFMFLMRLSSDHLTPATGKSVVAERSIDGGSFGTCTNAVSEMSIGCYKINFSAVDLNGDSVTFKFTASGCDPVFVTVKTNV
jgi:hypothetical protein